MDRYRWTILAVGVAAQAAVAAARQGLPVLGPALKEAFSLSLPQLGLVFGSLSLGIVITLIPWGLLSDRVGERAVIAIGLTGMGGALGAAALAGSYWTLVAALLVAGMFGASATGASGRAVTGWFARSQRGLALGIRQTGVPVGGATAALGLPLIVLAGGVQAALLALAAACFLASVAGWLWLREPPPPPATRPPSTAPAPTRDPRLWRLAVGSALLVVAQSSILGFVVIFLNEERGWSLGQAAALLGAMHVGASALRILAGRRSDHREERVAPMRLMGAAGAALIVAAAALTQAGDALLAPALVGAGIASMGWNGLSFTAAAEMSGRERAGTAISVQNAVLSAGGALAPVAFAPAVVVAGWPLAWGALAAFQLAGVAVLGASVREERARRAIRLQGARSRAVPGTLSP